MAWIESHQTLREHPKVYALMETLNKPKVEIVGHLHLLWWWCIDYAPTGNITGFSALQIARAADWTGEPKAFVEALVAARFIDRKEDQLAIHDWMDFCGQLMAKRLQRKASGGRTADNGGQIPPKEDGRKETDAYQPTNPTNQTEPDPTDHKRTEPEPACPQEPEDELVDAEVDGNPLIDFPLPGTGTYTVMDTHLADWQTAYPAVDIKTELAKMRVWLLENPKNRKTIKGIPRFIASWLGRAQDRAAKFPAVKKEQNFEGW